MLPTYKNKWKKKKQLRQLVKAYGYTDPIVLACSQELDQFVYVLCVIILLEQLHVKMIPIHQ